MAGDIAMRPLSSAGWHPFQAGELLVFKGGVLQFSNQRPVPTLVPAAASS